MSRYTKLSPTSDDALLLEIDRGTDYSFDFKFQKDGLGLDFNDYTILVEVYGEDNNRYTETLATLTTENDIFVDGERWIRVYITPTLTLNERRTKLYIKVFYININNNDNKELFIKGEIRII